MGIGGVASGTQLISGIAGGWPLPMGHRPAVRYGGLHGSSAVGHGDVATMVLLGWCLVRQWIQVPASTCCGGASFSSSSKWWILLLFTETGTHSVNCASRRLPCHGAEDVSLGLVSRPQRFPSAVQRSGVSCPCRAGSADSCDVVGGGRDPTVAARILLDRLLLARCVQQQMPKVVVAVHRQ